MDGSLETTTPAGRSSRSRSRNPLRVTRRIRPSSPAAQSSWATASCRLWSNIPVVGVLGGYSAEREGLRKAAAKAAAVLDGRVSPPT